MREEKKSVTKLKFKRLMRKKWLFPALYLGVAALVLVGVFWYQQSSNEVADQFKEGQSQDDVYVDQDNPSVPVTSHNENLQMPVADQEQATVVTKFFDYGATDEEQESALVLYNNKYYQSKGIDITQGEGEAFDVTASLSGTVTEVKEDPLYGNVVELTHGEEVTTVYSSLAEVQVQSGDEVKQGDVLGQSGQSSFGQDSGVHVHFEVRKNGEPVNPESFFGQAASAIEAPAAEEEAAATSEEDGTADETVENADESAESTESDAAPEGEEGVESEGTQTDDNTDAPAEENADEGTEETDQPELDEDTSSSRSTTQS
ncbi:M23 family metallopeptidase [Halobacillus sp. Marseille-Q1614]|uniref:M23 family metallopeptidase n=1 Tax=Halobacillus sp. Marseille-Q1614 TaxID=2709134 RepID=UPI001570EB12|nr:M23 family metallopeptidase [Halobacillus sp. Marseille-Q1614]